MVPRQLAVKCASFRFYAELNDYLPLERRMTAFEYRMVEAVPLQDTIASLGVPLREIDLILANGQSVDFSYVPRDGDRISIYPVFEALDIAPLVRVRPEPLREPRFILDARLGRLAVYLRAAGFDTLYRRDIGNEELARISRDERRILLTRDSELLERTDITHGYVVRDTTIRRQWDEVMRRFDLFRLARPIAHLME
jgi:hypothetical protein